MSASERLLCRLQTELSVSDSKLRKYFASQIVDGCIPLSDLLPLLHRNDATSQRFMWLIGDVCELAPEVVEPCLPFLFSIRDQVKFPGLPRSLAKWLLLTNVPKNVESMAIPQLSSWLENSSTSIACKSYSAKVLSTLVQQDRFSKQDLARLFRRETRHSNRAYAARIKKLLDQFSDS